MKYLHDVAKEDKIPDVDFDQDFIQQRIDAWNEFGAYGVYFSIFLLFLADNGNYSGRFSPIRLD
jgi:hypothetical protein